VKISLACQSVLLEKSLKLFLKNYIYPYKQCDFVIADRKIEIDKPLFYISYDDSNLNIPFSKSSLILSIENFYNTIFKKDLIVEEKVVKEVNIDKIEKKITELTNNFRDDLVKVIKDYYDK
jgi:hypothetical protein